MSELSTQFLVKAKESSSLRQSRISREVLKVDCYMLVLMKNTERRMKTEAFLLVFNRVNNEAGLSEKLQQLTVIVGYMFSTERTPATVFPPTMTGSGFFLTYPTRE